MRRLLVSSVAVVALASAMAAQPPASGGTPVPPESAPTPPPNYTYEAEGRRDPFLSLVNRGADPRAAQARNARPDGLPGLLIEEVAVRGIVQTRGGWLAMIASPNGRTYTIRPGDRLMDGRVRTITADAVVFLQDVNDPLSLEKQREVRKHLRQEVK